jgi:2-dehydropantoate 2-reductase
VEAVADAFGEKMAVDVDARLNGAAEVGEHKTSMLQDLELGRPMEVDAIVSAVVELARITNVDTPNLDALDGMIRLLARNAQP